MIGIFLQDQSFLFANDIRDGGAGHEIPDQGVQRSPVAVNSALVDAVTILFSIQAGGGLYGFTRGGDDLQEGYFGWIHGQAVPAPGPTPAGDESPCLKGLDDLLGEFGGDSLAGFHPVQGLGPSGGFSQLHKDADRVS